MDQTGIDIPLFPLRTVLYPGGPLPLRIFETRYVDMVGRCLKQDLGFGVIAQVESRQQDRVALHQVGTLARIVDWYQFDDGLLGITAVGETRFLLKEIHRQEDGLNVGRVEFLEPEAPLPMSDRFTPLLTLLENILAELEPQYRFIEKHFDDAGWVGCRLAEVLPLSLEQKQMFLELSDPLKRLDMLMPLVESLRK
ncbi:MAG: LON peptidase substrate-binding domain-containing protein [Gammaproteobacteria bacterium]|jgi:Lon protease-like protein